MLIATSKRSFAQRLGADLVRSQPVLNVGDRRAMNGGRTLVWGEVVRLVAAFCVCLVLSGLHPLSAEETDAFIATIDRIKQSIGAVTCAHASGDGARAWHGILYRHARCISNGRSRYQGLR